MRSGTVEPDGIATLHPGRRAHSAAALRIARDLQGADVRLWGEDGLALGCGTLHARSGEAARRILVEDPAALTRVARSRRLGVTPAGSGEPRATLSPVWCDQFDVDEGCGAVSALLPTEPQRPLLYELSGEPAARLEPCTRGGPSLAAKVVALGPFEGAFTLRAHDPRVHPGAVATLRAPCVSGHPQAMQIQITAQAAGDRHWFRVVDRGSFAAAVELLLEWAPSFSFLEAAALGVGSRRAARRVVAGVVHDAGSLRDALEVRLLANQSFGRLAGVRDPWDLLDDLDGHAVNVLCRLGRKPVGAGRVVVVGGDRSRSECERSVALPDWLWRAGFVEVSRFAVHPGYRGANVIVELFREVARIALRLRARYLVLDCIDKLVPIYERIGARRLGLGKQHPYSSERVHLLYVDVLESLTRLRRFLAWAVVFGPVVRDPRNEHLLREYEHTMGFAPRLAYRLKRGAAGIVLSALRRPSA